MKEWVWDVISKAGGTAVLIAALIIIVFMIYICKLLIVNRKSITGFVNDYVAKKNKEEELYKIVYDSKGKIEALERQIEEFKNNRIRDRQQSFEIQEKFTTAITALVERLDDMQNRENKRQRAKLKDRIGEMYREISAKGYWNYMEKEVLEDLIEEYEEVGGNSFVHDKVQPESCTWKFIKKEDMEVITKNGL